MLHCTTTTGLFGIFNELHKYKITTLTLVTTAMAEASMYLD